ncbi:hypothetical protein LTR64_002465 [Lithohypha guttulata]|uniref:uncharacterized protein n=1 Tax=Lithohypha guttulata TaxID=1690604 RepID=UPI002DE06FC4|nr:hypothetical protein LTR51_001309 [Lithohypha guttulata]
MIQPLDGTATNGHAEHPGLLPQWHSQPRKLRIIHIGAGATGLCAAWKMERQLTDYELVCYEKNADIGGTWLEKIQQYFVNFAKKYDLMKWVKLQHRVLSAVWQEDRGQWEVTVEHNGETFTDFCDILLNGSGLLNKWRWPKIEGLHDFEGPLLHSAAWDASVDMKGKRVAVLGTGSSAIQITPQVQKVASHLKCFMRSTTWISPPMQRMPVDLGVGKPKGEGFDHIDPETLRDYDNDDPNIAQYFYKPHEIEALRTNPELLLKYRKTIEFEIGKGFEIFYKDSPASKMVKDYMVMSMKSRLENHPVLCKKLIPSWDVGCRRLTPGDGYLEALIKPNVEHVFDEISQITPKGLRTADGNFHEVDVIVAATGFDMAWTPHFSLIGRGGVNIKDKWSPVPNCYLGIAAPGFPNYIIMNGPRGALCNGTVLPSFESQIEYGIKMAKKMQSDRIKAMDVKENITNMLNRHVDQWHKGGVWSSDCKSWYKNNTVNGKIMCWGGSSLHYVKTIKTPRWEHFDITYMEDDPWAFLGSGRTKGEVDQDLEAMTPHIRLSDTPWEVV